MELDTQFSHDLVQIDDSTPTGEMSLSDRIMKVETPDMETGKEEEHSNAGSIFSGADSIGNDENSSKGDTSTEPSMETRKLELPEELSRNFVILTCDSTVEGGSCDVYLIGTSHFSQESCQEVEAIIRFLKPQVVFLELCPSRVSLLQPYTSVEVPTMVEMVEMWRENHNVFEVASEYIRAKIASKVEVLPGAEFRVAYEGAKSHGGKAILGDRPIEITLQRIWGEMSLWHKVKFLFITMFHSFFFPKAEEIEKMLKETKNKDMVSLVTEEMSKDFPSLAETLVHERDQYMASRLFDVAREGGSCG